MCSFFILNTLQRPLQNPLGSIKSFTLPSNWDRESSVCSQTGRCELGLKPPAAALSLSCPKPSPPAALIPKGPFTSSYPPPPPPESTLPACRQGLFWVNPKSHTAASPSPTLNKQVVGGGQPQRDLLRTSSKGELLPPPSQEPPSRYRLAVPSQCLPQTYISSCIPAALEASWWVASI